MSIWRYLYALLIFTSIIAIVCRVCAVLIEKKVKATKKYFRMVADSEIIIKYIEDIYEDINDIREYNKSRLLADGEFQFVTEYFNDIVVLNSNINKYNNTDFINMISVEEHKSNDLRAYFEANYQEFNPKTKEIIRKKVNLALMILLHNNDLYFSNQIVSESIAEIISKANSAYDVSFLKNDKETREMRKVQEAKKVLDDKGYTQSNPREWYYSTALSYAA